jgi:uncharacterized protein YbjQ (UPF0145 family)
VELLLNAALLGFFLLLGLLFGGHMERKHFQSLRHREQAMSHMLVTQLKSFPNYCPGSSPPCLIVAEFVVASDYLKSFLAGIRNLFGGEVKSYLTLVDRARREAILRVLEQARERGYNAVCNVRLDSADVGGNSIGRRMPMAAILASGTAYHAHHNG